LNRAGVGLKEKDYEALEIKYKKKEELIEWELERHAREEFRQHLIQLKSTAVDMPPLQRRQKELLRAAVESRRELLESAGR
jgi:hypothetical protein